ncbi:hypothetical protein FKW77_010453 [Venturia effusa]|uniref:Uncharacterized protein n=1 Tax=Venturia effusa TaxID=50376 RepID=A0A517L0H5_9PEZI|nr:hypothetical protein FKW77_010453 [Venturia effusa]
MPGLAPNPICSRCAARPQCYRSFSTTPFFLAISPESPNFIDVPRSKQDPKPPKPVVKGVLPVPKRIDLPDYKAASFVEFLDKTTPKPQDRSRPHGPNADRLAWKKRMAASRRRNLAQGLQELAIREEGTRITAQFRAERKNHQHETLSNMPERRDQALTTPSLANSVRQVIATRNMKTEFDSSTKRQMVNSKERKYANVQERKEQQRKDQLHTLYTHARHFITTEDALDAALDKTFGTDENPVRWSGRGLSVWALSGQPPTVQEMLNPDRNRRQNIYNFNKPEEQKTQYQQRMKQIAETLTGGRIA